MEQNPPWPTFAAASIVAEASPPASSQITAGHRRYLKHTPASTNTRWLPHKQQQQQAAASDGGTDGWLYKYLLGRSCPLP